MKKIFSILMMVLTINVVSAQTVKETKLFDNVSVTVKGGVTTPLYEPVEHFRGTFGLEFQKKITPILGLGVEGEWAVNTNQWPNSNYGRVGGVNNWHCDVDYQYVGALATTNLNNLFVGYKGLPRKFEVETVLGVGWGHTYSVYSQVPDNNFVTTKAGLNLNFNFGSEREFTVSLKPSVVWNMCDNGKADYNINRGALQLHVGFTYHFEGPTTRHFKICDKVYTEDQMTQFKEESNNRINELRAEMSTREFAYRRHIDDLTEQNEKLTDMLGDCQKSQSNNSSEVVYTPIQFPKCSAKLQNMDTVLKEWAKSINEDGGEFEIVGYASEEGTKKFNQELSLRRAQAVVEALIILGVNPDKLSAVGRGATNEFGDVLELNRVVNVK